ncbi:MAG: hypothetical protein DSY47_07975 [Hydrogenothermus sp.]|nr:MAG: hypothetical protein DSY47_07975 [Hydrogenothermus sp.]
MRGLILAVLIFMNTSFASIVFKPSKEVYRKGENVCFYIKNNTNKEIILPSSAPWVVFENDKLLFAPVATQQIVKIKPKQKKKWCWNQKDFDKNEILSGEYTIRLTVFENGKRKFLTFKVKIQPNYSDAQ